MSVQTNETCFDVDMNNSGIAFDNLTILRELGNIADLVRDEDFLQAVPKAKLGRVQWTPMFKCLKQGILDDMVQELNSMWEFENMPDKIATLEKQKEKFAEIDPDQKLWRPQLADVKSQLRAHDASNLRKQKDQLELLVAEYDAKVNRLKKNVSARRAYLKALQLDIQKYKKKSDEIAQRLNDKIKKHSDLIETVLPSSFDLDKIKMSERDSDVSISDDEKL